MARLDDAGVDRPDGNLVGALAADLDEIVVARCIGEVSSLARVVAQRILVRPQASDAAPFAGPFEWLPVVVAAAAFLALWKYKQDIMRVIGACALLGLATTLKR